ncbi:Guanylate kinase [compost metagenome]
MSKRIWVLVGPSGTGKTTIALELISKVPHLRKAITCTTRAPREGERSGVDYYFVSDEQFDFLLASGKLIEHTIYGGFRYGLPVDQFLEAEQAGADMLAVLDIQGVHALRSKFGLERIRAIFLCSPSEEELTRRMRERGSNPEEIARRLSLVPQELEDAEGCDYVLSTDAPYPEVYAQVVRLIAP